MDENIGADVGHRLAAGKAVGGIRIQAGDHFERGFEHAVAELGQQLAQTDDVFGLVGRELVQMVHNDMRGAAARQRNRQAGELVQQRLLQVFGGDAGRVEITQVLERDFQIFFAEHPFQRRVIDDFFDAFGQIAFFVEKIDQHMHMRRFQLRERMLAHLLVQIGVEVFFVGQIFPGAFAVFQTHIALRHRRRYQRRLVGQLVFAVALNLLQQRIVQQPVFHFALDFLARHLQHAQRLLHALVELLALFQLELEVVFAHGFKRLQ